MRNPQIDVCLTTISSRIASAGKVVETILRQEAVKPTVYLFISREPYLLDEGVPEIPEDLVSLQRNSEERFKIIYCPNWGPYRKFVPYLQRFWGRNRIFVTADDDTLYPSSWLATLFHLYLENRCVIGYRGHRILTGEAGFSGYRSWMKSGIKSNPSFANIPTGKDGVLYNASFFPASVLNMSAALRLAPTADDLWLKWNLAKVGIQTFLVHTDYRTSTFEETNSESSLYKNFNKGGGNDKSVSALDFYFKERLSFDFSLQINSMSS